MRIVLTGATGLLGRNLLFEFIKQYRDRLADLEIVVLGRDEPGTSLQERITDILLEDGLPYIGWQKKSTVYEFVSEKIKCIDSDLTVDRLGILRPDLYQLKAQPIDFFFHIASVTDFRDSEIVKKLLWESNVQGTERILELVRQLEVKEFCYVSSAYCCGQTSGKIMPDYVNLQQEFRNPYELSKLEAEIKTRNFAKNTGIRYRCFRPSTISGRLIEEPLGMVNKFDVFYGWASFWLHSKLRTIDNIDRRYSTPLTLDARICYSLNSGLNIVPADYAAKVIYAVCTQQDLGESYHIVNDEETPHDLYFQTIYEILNIKGVKIVEEVPDGLNKIESFYYKTVGKIFTKYITSEPMLFDTSNLTDILTKANLHCPKIDRHNFKILMGFAQQQDFGIDIKKFARDRVPTAEVHETEKLTISYP
jgi:nucleoside-diphosphate-sugar epimerase